MVESLKQPHSIRRHVLRHQKFRNEKKNVKVRNSTFIFQEKLAIECVTYNKIYGKKIQFCFSANYKMKMKAASRSFKFQMLKTKNEIKKEKLKLSIPFKSESIAISKSLAVFCFQDFVLSGTCHT